MPKTMTDIRADFEKRKRQSEMDRRRFVEGCSTCENIKKSGGFGPYHDASPRCRSGFYEHCSCEEACF